VAAVVLWEAGDIAGPIGARLAGLALISIVAVIVLGWSPLVAAALLLLGGAYAVRLGLDDPALDATAPLVAAGLFLTAELAYWSLEERARVQSDPGDALRRLGFLALLTLGSLATSGAVLALADAVRTGGFTVDLLGAAAAAAALLLVVLSARRPVR
jgi:hypothetical protein